MFKLLLFLLLLLNVVQCSADHAIFNATVYLSIQQTMIGNDQLACYNYAPDVLGAKISRGFYSPHRFQVEVNLDFKAFQNQVFSTEVYCMITLTNSSQYTALVSKDSLSDPQLGLNGSMTVLAHVEDLEILQAKSLECHNEQPSFFLEIKEYNLSFRYHNVFPLLIEFIRTVPDFFCVTRELI